MEPVPPGALLVPTAGSEMPTSSLDPKTRPQSSALPMTYVTSGIGWPSLGLISFLSLEGFKAAVRSPPGSGALWV